MLTHRVHRVHALPVTVVGQFVGALDLFRTEPHLLSRTEVSQATGMLVAQLDVDPTETLVRLRAHAYATNAAPPT